MVPGLQSGYYQLTWQNCTDLPSPMYNSSVVQHNDNVYVMAGDAPQRDTLDYVFSYNINMDEWSRLPPPGHYRGILQILNDKLTVIGGVDDATGKYTNKVSTFNNDHNNWSNHFSNMLQSRNRPGVLTYEGHVVVLGGAIGDGVYTDDIEVLNLTQPLQWKNSNMKLPKPMCDISVTTSHDQLYIVGYTTSDGRSSKAYQIPVDSIISSTVYSPTDDQIVEWVTLPRAPHYDTALLPYLHPIIVGGCDIQGVPTSDVAILNIMQNKWDRLASLHTARTSVAVIPISHESILVIGGTTSGEAIAESIDHCISTVEKGTASVSHRVTTIPTQDSTCTIQ